MGHREVGAVRRIEVMLSRQVLNALRSRQEKREEIKQASSHAAAAASWEAAAAAALSPPEEAAAAAELAAATTGSQGGLYLSRVFENIGSEKARRY